MDLSVAGFPIAVAILLIQRIHDHKLGDLSRDGTGLEGRLIGPAAQNHIGQFCGRRLDIAGHQHGFDAAALCQFQNLYTDGGGTGIGEQNDHVLGRQSRCHGDLTVGIWHC